MTRALLALLLILGHIPVAAGPRRRDVEHPGESATPAAPRSVMQIGSISEQFGGGPIPELHEAIAPEDRAEIERAIAAVGTITAHATSDDPAEYPFFPMSGIPGYDLYLSYTVDLDSVADAVMDFDCTKATYDGHGGHDMLMLTFRQQDIGTPVYAALDGVVVATHDGEPDRNTQWQDGLRSNYVVLRHTPNHHTYYLHFRKGSVAVETGQAVTAGTQLGLAASSGFSNWPHLHFESRTSTGPYEPSAGPCRPGRSYWSSQPAIGGNLFVREFAMSSQSFGSFPLVEDQAPRTATFVNGASVPIYVRVFLGHLPAQSTYRVALLRPDGSVLSEKKSGFNNASKFRLSSWWWGFTADLSVRGTYSVKMEINGQEMLSAPFTVVGAISEIVNRPPRAVTARIVPLFPKSDDVTRCEVVTSLIDEDPDYDVMSYRYEWIIGDNVVRDVVSAQLMDALPKGTLRDGEMVKCRVTPSDGKLNGPSFTVLSSDTGTRRRSVRH